MATRAYECEQPRSGNGRRRGAKRTSGATLGRGAQRAAAAMHERGFQSLMSGARALRKYAIMRCDFNLGNCACVCQTGTKGDSFRK
eukprot:356037-Pleurochrysis_carterae.AAC.2